MSDQAQMIDQRRLRTLYVPYGQMLDIVRIIFDRPDGYFFKLPKAAGLPEGCLVHSVHNCWARNAFALVLQHPSFEPAEPGCEIPAINGNFEAYQVVVELRFPGKGKADEKATD